MPGQRVFYYCPRSATPSGGVMTIYHHVETLSAHGIDAWVLHRRRGGPMSWFDSAAPVTTLDSGVTPRHPDVLVIPEGDWRLMADTAGSGLRRVVFAQGYSYIYGAGEPLPAGCDWRSWGIGDVMAVSRYVQRVVRWAMGLPSTLVRPGVDIQRFRPAAVRHLQIAYMPRKNANDLQQIQGLFRSRFPHLRSVPWIAIDEVPQAEVARRLGESAVFLATGYPEGFGLPPLEALASGCLVVGFTGRGGGEYLRHGQNALVAADGDVVGAADRLGRAIELLQRDPPAAASLVAAGLATAARLSRAASERAILRCWRRWLRAGPPPASRHRRRASPTVEPQQTAAAAAAPRVRPGRGMARRVAVLSVHYKYPELFADQLGRLAQSVAPTRRALGLRLEYYPIVHQRSTPEVVAAIRAGCAGSGFATPLDVGGAIAERATTGGAMHGAGIAAAFELLRGRLHLDPDDLVFLLDHDTHPLDVRLFARLGDELGERPELAGIGVPQWQRGHCYLHPSLLATRAAAIFEMGTRTAFEVRVPADQEGEDRNDWHDTAEGFTAWCERSGRALLPLRVNATRYPWQRWDSDMVPNQGARLTGEHGEPVVVGNLMHYGLDGATSLASHVWAGPLGPYRWLGLSDYSRDAVFAAYLAEPLAG
jgi:hypothetical protein